MHTIFDPCQDIFGICIRQYIDAGLILFISMISLYSVYHTYRSNHQITFQMLPLALNFLVSLIIFLLQILYEEYYNTHLIFMFIEIFTYYLLTYALVWMYVKADVVPNLNIIRRINIGFVFGSVAILLVAILVTILSFVDVIKCNSFYWIATVTQTIVLAPIYVCTLIYCQKTKQKIHQFNQNDNMSPSTIHLINEEDSFLKLKLLQTNLNQITFTFSMLLHIAEITLYFFMQNDSICINQTNNIYVRNQIELSIMIIKNLSELIPHIMILLIFWIIPEKIDRKSPATIYITPKKINVTNYKIDNDEQEIHRKLIS